MGHKYLQYFIHSLSIESLDLNKSIFLMANGYLLTQTETERQYTFSYIPTFSSCFVVLSGDRPRDPPLGFEWFNPRFESLFERFIGILPRRSVYMR